MADKVVLPLSSRTIKGKQNTKLRADGFTPAVVYGHGKDPQAVSVDSRILEKTFATAGGNQIIGLKIDDAKMTNALMHDIQFNGRTGLIDHVDFYLVRMDEKIKTEVPVLITGESTAVYQMEGSLMRPIESIEIEALPGDLPDNFEVDIASLDDFTKAITVADLKAPTGVEILTDAGQVLAKVDPPRSDDELEDLNAPIDEAAEMPEGVQEDQEVIEEDQATSKEPQNKAAGADPAAAK